MTEENRPLQKVAPVAKETTEAEILATRCEMEVQQYKMCEYMQDKVGETLEGTVSGVTEHGIFVVLPNQVEGFIPAVKLNTDEDTFYFNSDTLSYISHDKRKVYTFGTPFRVTIANVSLSNGKYTSFRRTERNKNKKSAWHFQQTFLSKILNSLEVWFERIV